MAHLQATGISKSYGGVKALSDVDFSCRRGEIHALLGANGSGKSTLSKIITGVVVADKGTVYINDQATLIRGPNDMYTRGISAVYQELSLIPQMTVAENILLGQEPVKYGRIQNKTMWARATEFLESISSKLETDIPLHAVVSSLSSAEQQLVEIAKALSREPEILILDEATASLRENEVAVVFDHVRRLKEQGCTVIFISHRLGEVFDLCDRATVLRNGKVVATVELPDTNEQELLDYMLGEVSTVDVSGIPAPRSQVVLEVHELNSEDGFSNVSFSVRSGEILGLGGLQGQGQTELIQAIYGARAHTGRIVCKGKKVQINSPADAIKEGIVLVPGNRNAEGLALQRSVLENVTLPSVNQRSHFGLLKRRDEIKATRYVVDRLQIQVADVQLPINTLSGGNQQKVVVGKWFLSKPQIMLLDDPTKGVDVQSRVEIYHAIEGLCSQGVAVVISSSDNKELLSLSHRILVMYEGRIVGELTGDTLTEEHLIATGMRIGNSKMPLKEVSDFAD